MGPKTNLDYEPAHFMFNDIAYTVRGSVKKRSDSLDAERYIVEYKAGNGPLSFTKVDVMPLRGGEVKIMDDLSQVVKDGLIRALDEYQSCFGNKGRNDSNNFFLGKEVHKIAGRRYKISAPTMSHDKNYICKKEYVAQSLDSKKKPHLIILSAVKEGNRTKLFWVGADKTEKLDLEMMIKPNMQNVLLNF